MTFSLSGLTALNIFVKRKNIYATFQTFLFTQMRSSEFQIEVINYSDCVNGLAGIPACAPPATPYVSTIDPCAPDLLTAIALSGAIPRCDKIPTDSASIKTSLDNDREREVSDYFNRVITNPKSDSSAQALAKYINNIEIVVEDSALSFIMNTNLTNDDDIFLFAGELIRYGTLVSRAGSGSGDWRLGIIEVVFPGNPGGCGTSYFVNNVDDLARIAQQEIEAKDVMEIFVCE